MKKHKFQTDEMPAEIDFSKGRAENSTAPAQS